MVTVEIKKNDRKLTRENIKNWVGDNIDDILATGFSVAALLYASGYFINAINRLRK